MIVTFATGSVSWTSHKQKTVALSSTEAEYMAASDTSRQLMWIKTLFNEIGFKLGSMPLMVDNQGSSFLASNPMQERRTKHIDIRYHFIREKVEAGIIDLYYIQTEDNVADLLTKNLALVKFVKLRNCLGLLFKHIH